MVNINVVSKILMVCVVYITTLSQVSESTCSHGDIRLVNGETVSEFDGRVEVCVDGEWGTVCQDWWGTNDATVVCRQLGYSASNSIAVKAKDGDEPVFGRGNGSILMDNVNCRGDEILLLDCIFRTDHNCDHRKDAGVRCTESQTSTQELIHIEPSTTSVSLNWNQFFNTLSWQDTWTGFSIACSSYSEQHSVRQSLPGNETFNVRLNGLHPSSPHRCCVSVINGRFNSNGVCSDTLTLHPQTTAPTTVSGDPVPSCSCATIETDTTNASTSSSSTPATKAVGAAPSIIGGVLGFIIIVLVVVLVLVGMVCVYLYFIRSKVKQKLPTSRATGQDLALHNPIYNGDTCPTLPVVTRGPNSLKRESNDQYSVLGPSYEIIDQSKQGRSAPPLTHNTTQQNTVTSMYEYAKFGNGNSEGDNVNPVVYEVPVKQQDDDNGDYSKLQH